MPRESKERKVEHQLTVPAGPLAAKYRDFVWNEQFKEMAFIGPFNCLGANTRIYDSDSERYVPVHELYERGQPVVVLARTDDGDVTPVRAGVPFIKGRSAIYRFLLSDGTSFEATLDHAVLSGCQYRTLRQVLRDPTDPGIEHVGTPDLLPSSWAEAPPESRRDAVRSTRTPVGWSARYSEGRRQYDALLHQALNTARGCIPSPVGVLARIHAGLHAGGAVGIGTSIPLPAFGLPSNSSVDHPTAPPESFSGGYRGASCTSEGFWGLFPRGVDSESLGLIVPDLQGSESDFCAPKTYYASPCVKRTIKGVEYVRHDWYYDLEVPHLHNYLAEGVFHHNTSKSTALVDWLIVSGLQYPGANLVLTRAKLSDLRRTTLTKYLSRAGKVLTENYNKNEAIIEFPEINGKKSTLYMFGLDRHDLTEVLKSFEPFRAAIEESNEVPPEAFDMLLGRLRQKVEHVERTNRWLAYDMAQRWGVTPQRAQQILGFSDSEMDDFHLGKNQLKHVFNPEGNDHAWKRMVGVAYPSKQEMGPEWVREHVGKREFILKPGEYGDYEFAPGNYILLPDGSRVFTAGQQKNPATGQLEVELVDGRKIAREDVSFIGQRAAIFAFTNENWSRNRSADENFLYMNDPTIREKYYEAKIDTKQGLVFPEFDRPTHVIPKPKRDLPGHLRGIVSVDQGFRHPTVGLFAVELVKPAGAIFILKEYLVSGRSSMDNAYQIKGMPPVQLESVTYWGDPSMWRLEPTSMRSVADDYFTAGVPLMKAENQIELTIDQAKQLLTPLPDLQTGVETPRIFISEECEQLIHALETAEWRHMQSARDNWVVDMIDGFRYLISGTKQQAGMDFGAGETLESHVRVWDWA